MKPFLWVLLVSLFVVTSVRADDQAHQIQQIRVLGFELINNMLAFYNPNGEGMDSRFEQRYQAALTGLNELVPNQGEMRTAVEQIHQKLVDLDENARNTPEYLYSHWVNPMLKAHAALDQLAAQRYRSTTPSAIQAAQHELNLNLCRLLLLYQTRTFGTLGVFVMTMDEDTFTRLDRGIVGGLEQLKEARPESREALDKLATQYAFVRPRLMQHGEKWVPGITAYYMGNISRGLAGLSL